MKINKLKGFKRGPLLFKQLPKQLQVALLEQTSFDNPAYNAALRHSPYGTVANIPERFEFSDLHSEGLVMLRGALSFLPKAKRAHVMGLVEFVDQRTDVPVKWPAVKLEYNKEQLQCLASLKEALAKNTRPFGNFLFIASTAVGKTILQSAAAALLGQRTLVLCPTDQIMRAWYADLAKLFKFTSKQIGVLRQKKFIVGEQITIASIATLGRRRDLWSEYNKLFGTVIVDEVHSVTAPLLFEFLAQSPAKYLVGATATMQTRMGFNYQLKALFGNPLISLDTYGHDTANSMRVSDVRLIDTTFKYRHQQDNIDWNDLGPALTMDEERNKVIVANVLKDWHSGGVILIVTKYLEHVELLLQMFNEAGINNANALTGATNAQRFYSDRLMKAIAQRRVTCVVATMQAIKLGANIPTLDALHIAMPPANTRDFEQLIGRVRRKASGKTQATVTYYLDHNVGYLANLYKRIAVPTFRKLKLPGFENLFMV